jgi:hypothetical protein
MCNFRANERGMKSIRLSAAVLIGLCSAASPVTLKAQFLKNLLTTVKQTATNRANDKAASTTNKALDKVDASTQAKSPIAASQSSSSLQSTAPGQASVQTAGQTTPQSTNGSKGSSAGNAPGANPADKDSDSSYLQLNLSSTKVLQGGTVVITGSSVMYGSLKQVALTITGPSVNYSKNIPLSANGSFSTTWQAGGAGDYLVTAKSSNGKEQKSATVSAFRFVEMDRLTDDNKKATTTAYDNLKAQTDLVIGQLSPTDGLDLKKKMDDVSQKKDKVLKLFDDLDIAGKGLDGVEKKYGQLTPDISADLSQLTDLLSTQAQQMTQANTMAAHKPSDNTICEYLVMVSEACAAFSTITNFWAKSMGGVLKNIAIDKAVPAAAGGVNGLTKVNSDAGNIHKECDKVVSTALYDTESLTSALGVAGFAGDLAQMCIDHFLKKYCAVMSGTLNHDYQCTFTNDDHNVWWKYNYTTEATISLRYPKNNSGGRIIKMKGNIEGNATKFSIFQDMEQMQEFKDKMKNRAKLYPIRIYAPTAVSFATSQHDVGGFGAVARAVVTPAYFNIPIDADYDTEAKKLKIYLNSPIMDFNPKLVSYIYAYIAIAAGIPLVTRVDFPINPVKLTLGKVIEKNNDFNIQTDSQNNLSVNGKGNWQLGKDTPIEHIINFSFSLKSE